MSRKHFFVPADSRHDFLHFAGESSQRPYSSGS